MYYRKLCVCVYGHAWRHPRAIWVCVLLGYVLFVWLHACVCMLVVGVIMAESWHKAVGIKRQHAIPFKHTFTHTKQCLHIHTHSRVVSDVITWRACWQWPHLQEGLWQTGRSCPLLRGRCSHSCFEATRVEAGTGCSLTGKRLSPKPEKDGWMIWVRRENWKSR